MITTDIFLIMAESADGRSASNSAVENRFADAIEEDVFNILMNINSKNTNKSTKFAIKLLRDYCLSKNRNVDFENMDINELKTPLKEFYINLRNH